jgi:hypothetical protein
VAGFATFTFARLIRLTPSFARTPPIDIAAIMSSSEEENFNIDISDDESEEDYAPVVKKKITATVCFSISAT